MAQFSILLPVLALFTLCQPIVCSYGYLSYDRRYRAPYIDFSEYSTQQLGQAVGTIGSPLRKPSTYTENNANYRHQEQKVAVQQVVGPAVHNRANPASYRNHRDDITTLTVLNKNRRSIFKNVNQFHHNDRYETTTRTVLEQNLRNIFDSNFVSGLHLFDNVNRPHFNSYTEQMIGDQPDPYSFASAQTSSDKKFLPNEKLGLVYNDDNIMKKGTDSTSLSGSTSDSNKNINSNNRDSYENHFHTPLSGGLSLTKGKVETSAQDHIRKNETDPAYIVDSKDCVEDNAKSAKTFCIRLRNYPEQSHLEEIIKTKFNNLESFLDEDMLLSQNMSERLKNEPVEEFLCRSRTRVIYPEAGLNKDSEWLFIINTKKYKQGVRIEECINEGSACDSIYPPNNYKASCRQNYIYRSLMAYSNGTIVKDMFKMPCCCKCVLSIY